MAQVKCRVCGQYFERKEELRDIDWIMPSKNWYYHKKCYEDWKESKEHPEDDWVLLIYDLIKRELKGNYSWWQIEGQRKKFIAQRMTNKGIYYTLYWYFIIKKNAWVEDYGIGIVPHIYEQAQKYWIQSETATAGIMDQILEIARSKIERCHVPVKTTQRRTKKIKAPTD